ncbi:MarR family winged helix-turn-helix transcriptional regulator [Gordonia soli]|uniref:Putative MarR family transcriptional regulator n=1 Tax=Gordonia soli NBRC 108243 TaxID=1223545 RepID=M0QIJ2_9ACTN|nr:MarR family transcriptional regulator [Gordonia soli]GAC67257.1 putative MarR family transcriptional regulator [Gordonia soli NBRC 108243]
MTANPTQRLLSDSALTVFRLNGQFLALAEELAASAGLTATRWQVLGAVLREPASVSEIARIMGITRQSVQRTADLLVADGLAEYRDNPAHRRAKLVAPTSAGYDALDRINPAHRLAAQALAERLDPEEWRRTVDALQKLSTTLAELDTETGR